MNNLYFEDLYEGLQDTLAKKANEHLFTSPNNTSLFPTQNSQTKWQFSKGDNFLRLHDGQKVYAFHLPTGATENEDFAAERQEDMEPSKFHDGATSKGLAQVHRSDPGSIYFTLQEGKNNPTFTLKHTGEKNWRGTPKKRKAKEVVVPNLDLDAVKQGMLASFDAKKKEKQAGSLGDNIMSLGSKLPNIFQRVVQYPGEVTNNIEHELGNGGVNSLLAPAATGALGALGGAGYHFGRRALYNTQEENEEEDQDNTLLKRMLIPGLGGAMVGGVESSLFNKRYEDLRAGAGAASNIT